MTTSLEPSTKSRKRDSSSCIAVAHPRAAGRAARCWSNRDLDRAGIPSRVLKGVAFVAHGLRRSERTRLRRRRPARAGIALTRSSEVLADRLDGERPQPELRPGFDDRFGKEVMLRVGSLELDLHRTFVEGAYGLTVHLDDLFAPPYRFPLGVTELEALPMPQRLLHAGYAAAFGDWPPRLVSLRDVAQLVLREKPNLVDVLLMARVGQCEPIVARAVVSSRGTSSPCSLVPTDRRVGAAIRADRVPAADARLARGPGRVPSPARSPRLLGAARHQRAARLPSGDHVPATLVPRRA